MDVLIALKSKGLNSLLKNQVIFIGLLGVNKILYEYNIVGNKDNSFYI